MEAAPTRSMFRRGLEVFAENKLALVGMVLLLAIVFFCFIGPYFYHTNQVNTDLLNANQPPGNGHPLGTDADGYDVLGRLMPAGQHLTGTRVRVRGRGHRLSAPCGERSRATSAAGSTRS